MKRIWVGVGFLVVLLIVGLSVMQVTEHQLEALSQTVQQAAEAESWAEAAALVQNAQANWNQQRHLMAAFADHEDIDTVDQIFAQLKIYQGHQTKTAHAAACAQLSEALKSLRDAQRLTWWNLL